MTRRPWSAAEFRLIGSGTARWLALAAVAVWFGVWLLEHGVAGVASLVVVSWKFVAAMGAVVLLSWLGVVTVALRGHNRWSIALRAVLALAMTVLLVATTVNSYFSYLPTVSDVVAAADGSNPPPFSPVLAAATSRVPNRGRLTLLPIPTGTSGFGRSDAYVWLPPQYFTQPQRRFPVVYLFHGSPGMPADWFRAGEADRIALSLASRDLAAIIVAPAMSHGWLDDPECVDGLHEKVATHFFAEVIPTVDQQLRTQALRSGRVFAGMSAGGYCALNLGLRRPGMAATILDLSGYTEPTHSGGLRALFGPAGATAARDNSPSAYAATLRALPASRIWLDTGHDDHLIEREMNQLAPVLRSRGFVVDQHVRPGSHTYSVWRPALRQSLEWALQPRTS